MRKVGHGIGKAFKTVGHGLSKGAKTVYKKGIKPAGKFAIGVVKKGWTFTKKAFSTGEKVANSGLDTVGRISDKAPDIASNTLDAFGNMSKLLSNPLAMAAAAGVGLIVVSKI
jgi:hypothetical protein